jgi:hypothetical protein
VATVKELTRIGLPPRTHLYDDPDLSPLEFLQCVYRDPSLPMSYRMEAAKAALPYTDPFPSKVQGYVSYHCRIILGGLGPCDHEFCLPTDPTTRNHSQISSGASKTVTHNLEAVAPVNLETIPSPLNIETPSNTPFVPDYSSPPDPAVFEAALKYGYPAPHLCSYCGHWLTVTYPDCICADCSSRDPSKMN